MANLINPFDKGVTYEKFLSQVKGKTTLDSLIKKLKLEPEQEKWLRVELNNYIKK